MFMQFMQFMQQEYYEQQKRMKYCYWQKMRTTQM